MAMIRLLATMTLVLATLIDLSLGQSSATPQRLRKASLTDAEDLPRPRRRLEEGNVVCRVTVESTRMADGTDSAVTLCVPVENGIESDRPVPISLPDPVAFDNELTINDGRLVVQLSNSTVTGDNVTITDQTDITVLSSEEAADFYADPNHHRRVLGDRSLATTGTRTIAVIRVSAGGSTNRFLATELRKVWAGSSKSFRTQMKQCSSGALNWKLNALYNVKLNQDITSFASRGDMQTAIETQLKNMVGKDLQYVADTLVFCYPPNSPGSWIASATMNYWRATFNDGWCTSLSAAMHEVGHTIGLLHSAKGTDTYGDTTGMLGYSYGGEAAPQKCYNGAKNWQLGWYSGRRQSVSSTQVIRLASFVDYSITASNEPVVVQVYGKYYIQYNVVKSYNFQSDMYQNRVTVTGIRSDNLSTSLAGLAAGDLFSDGTIKIKACSATKGSSGQDIMIVAIGGNCP